MKLKNKKTGEIHDITEVVFLHDMDKKFVIYSQTEGHNYAYKNLAELNEEWEDTPEEPKEYWYLDCYGMVLRALYNGNEWDERRKLIGNYFETKEEAEKAVEKLKAWKRLKDKGFRFTGFEETDRGCLGDFTIYCYVKPDYTRPYDDVKDDLDLLFGGEE